MATHFFGSAFFTGEFFFGQVLVDTHDGGERKRRREFREDKERLHTQLESAFESAFNKSGKPILRPAISSIEPDDDEDWLILL